MLTLSKATIEALNSFSLHHSNHPSMVLISKELEGDNCSTWSRGMRISLSTKDKIGFVIGSIKLPPTPLTDDSFPSWQWCNDMVISWLLNSIHPYITNSVIYAETSTQIWVDLKECFSQWNDSRIYQIKRDIVEHRWANNQFKFTTQSFKLFGMNFHPIIKCYPTLVEGWRNSRKWMKKKRVMQFLMGLNDSYATIDGQILLMQPLPDACRVYSLVLQ